ncbi:hypothetical protein ACHAWO_003295 [Cyclotella atomus]|uniref:Uncharacterized protein n=1 Tax=Cyclotella atomus TaxID=382360 RepID=A0ABD3QBE4_9STRA
MSSSANAKEDAIINPYVNRPHTIHQSSYIEYNELCCPSGLWVEEAKHVTRGNIAHSIPRYFDENLQSTKPDEIHCCVTTTLVGYIGQVFEGHRTQPLYRCESDNIQGLAIMYLQTRRGSYAIGRPGEIKYDDYNDWYFDLLTELVDTSWKESKNLKKYTMPRVSDDFFGFDWYCVMGAFFMCEDGLFRSEEQIEQGKLNAVFVRLHQLQDASVAGKLAAAIQSNIPDNVLEEIRKLFTGKSLRKGAITELSMNSGLSIFNLSARSGHSLGVAMQDYVDQNNPAASFPAANALHGQRTLSAIPVLPDFNAVGSSNRNQWVALVKAAFVITIPDFMPGGRHSIILEVMMASMAVESIKLYDVQLPLLTPDLVLVEWSKKLSQDYKEQE